MSATGRSAVRDPADYYSTPAWCVKRLLEAVDLPGGLWLEPCAGEGAIIRAVSEVRSDVHWHAVEYRAECEPALCDLRLRDGSRAVYSSWPHPFSTWGHESQFYDVCLTNPPYRSALAFVQQAIREARIVAMLLRLNWLSSADRAPWLKEHMPSVFVLPDRPSFVGSGGDATDYAWMAWGLSRVSRVHLLATTPLSERSTHNERTRGQADLFGDAA